MLSIITACLNRTDFIETAIRSVLDQNYHPFEHIIIDGGSTDGTLEILKRYPHLRVISEPDNGVYDAMNKGIHMAKGEIIGLLNSDDYYEKGCFSHAAHVFINDPTVVAVVGNARVLTQENDGRNKEIKIHYSSMLLNPLHAATFGVPIINAWFLNKDVLEKLGEFDLRYRLAADRDFLIRFYLAGFNFFISEKVFYNYLQHENSLTITDNPIRRLEYLKENISVAHKYMSALQMSIRAQSKKWYIFLVSEVCKTALRIKDYETIVIYLTQLIRKNPLWIFSLLIKNLHLVKRIPEIWKIKP